MVSPYVRQDEKRCLKVRANLGSGNAIRIDQGGPSSDPDVASSLSILEVLCERGDVTRRYLAIYRQLVAAFSHMLAPQLVGDQTLPAISSDPDPLARAAEGIGLASTHGLELDQGAMDYIQDLLLRRDDFPELP
jgi:hypothetical protein